MYQGDDGYFPILLCLGFITVVVSTAVNVNLHTLIASNYTQLNLDIGKYNNYSHYYFPYYRIVCFEIVESRHFSLFLFLFNKNFFTFVQLCFLFPWDQSSFTVLSAGSVLVRYSQSFSALSPLIMSEGLIISFLSLISSSFSSSKFKMEPCYNAEVVETILMQYKIESLYPSAPCPLSRKNASAQVILILFFHLVLFWIIQDVVGVSLAEVTSLIGDLMASCSNSRPVQMLSSKSGDSSLNYLDFFFANELIIPLLVSVFVTICVFAILMCTCCCHQMKKKTNMSISSSCAANCPFNGFVEVCFNFNCFH